MNTVIIISVIAFLIVCYYVAYKIHNFNNKLIKVSAKIAAIISLIKKEHPASLGFCGVFGDLNKALKNHCVKCSGYLDCKRDYKDSESYSFFACYH